MDFPALLCSSKHPQNNNEASTVLDLFVRATNIYHYPRRIHTDYSTENVDVARLMLTRYGVDSKPVQEARQGFLQLMYMSGQLN